MDHTSKQFLPKQEKIGDRTALFVSVFLLILIINVSTYMIRISEKFVRECILYSIFVM